MLEYDDFRHVEADYCLVGQRSGKKFRMGDKVMIKVVAANLTKRQLDYEWVVTGELADGKKKQVRQEVKNGSSLILRYDFVSLKNERMY